jgi:protoporphyrin/coproporphyrin ferrochelatase
VKKGILLINLGTPDDPSWSSVYRYLKQFLLDRRVIDIPWALRQVLVRGIIVPFRSNSSSKLYKMLWTPEGSPIKIYGFSLLEKLRKKVDANTVVELAMRYQNPSIEKALMKLIYEDKVSEITVFPLFPQYASASTGSAHDEVMRVLRGLEMIPAIKFINSYPTNPALIDVFAANANKYNLKDYDHFIFSFHGLPQRHMRKVDLTGNHCTKAKDCCHTMCDANMHCYSAQCHQTAFAIAKKLNISKENYSISFQSRLGRDPWLQPYTDKMLEERLEKGNKKILVFSPAFVADCLETTIEIGHEYKEDFMENGGEKLDLVESLNDNDLWVDAVYEMVK